MATKATPKNFAVQQIFEILMQKPSDNSIIGYLKHCKTTSIENTMEMVYPTGGRGNHYIGGGFGHSKRATFNIENATWNTQIIAAQNGTDVVTGETTYTKYVQVDLVDSQTDYSLPTPAAKGTGDTRHIGTIYGTNASGDYVMVLTEDDTASTGKFSYTEGSPAKITLDSGDVKNLVETLGAVKLTMAYTVKSAAIAQRIDIRADDTPDTVLVTAYGFVSDLCDSVRYPCVIHGLAQIDGNWNWDLTADGDPAVQNISVEFVTSCSSDDLYSIIIDTDEE